MDWNPDRPFVLGPQVVAGCREGQLPGVAVGSPATAVAQRYESTVTETIEFYRTFWAAQYPGTFMVVEALKAGQEIPSNRVTTVLRPTSSTTTGDTWRNQADSPTAANLYLSVDESTLNMADYIYTAITHPGGSQRVDFGFSGASGILTGKRILAVRLCMQGGIIAQSGAAVSTLRGSFNGGYTFSRKVGIFPIGPLAVGPGIMYAGEINPSNAAQWTVADIQSLAVGQKIGLDAQNPLPDNQNDFIFIYQLWLEIDSCDENRYTRDLAYTILPGNRWDAGVAQKPDGTANWSKVNGNDFTMIVRTPIQGDQTPHPVRVSLPYIPLIGDAAPVRDGAVVPYPNVVMAGDGTVASLGVSVTDRMFPSLVQPDPLTITSVDSQPYASVVEVRIDASHTAQSEFSGAAATDYEGVYLPLAVDETAGLVSDLTVTLKRRTDNVTLGTATITRTAALDVAVSGRQRFWRLVQQDFASPATLATATQYYLEFSSPGPGSWLVQLLTADAPTRPTGATSSTIPNGNASYDGETDRATVNGVDDARGDFAVLVYQAPAAIDDFTVDPAILPITTDEDCEVDGLTAVQVGWTPTTDPDGLFGYYEMQRSDPYTDWATVYRSDGQVLAFTDVYLDEYIDLYDGGYGPGGGIDASHIYDWEARIGVESCYRIRLVNRFGIAGPWSDELCATRPGGGCGYVLTSNTLDPLLFVMYPDAYTSNPERAFTFPEADEVTYRRIYGRDNFIALRPTERRGVRFDRGLWVNALVTPARPQWEVFDALRDLCANTTVPYLAVCDESGGRVFASVVCPDGRIQYPDEWYFATIRVTQTADDPAP